MSNTTIELLPLRPAIRTDAPVTLDVLVRILPPPRPECLQRPRLNLALVLDHSGSMAGSGKMDYARQAATYAVQQLLPEDRVSLTIFDDNVKVLFPSALATRRQELIDLIRGIQPAGSTALHAGWQTGARQVQEHLLPEGVNRVLLLTDGLANVGETNPDTICSEVKAMNRQGVSTSTMGVGRDYNENLLESMARSGEGNYYFIESPRQLPDFFQSELHGLMATVGQQVLLTVEPQPGILATEVINDLDRDAQGRLILPNLLIGLPLEIVLRLQVAAQSTTTDLCGFRLSWQHPQDGEQFLAATLRLPAVGMAEWEAMEPDPTVREQTALQMANRAKRESSRLLDAGEVVASLVMLGEARALTECLPASPAQMQELQDLAEVERQVREGEHTLASKKAKYQHYNRSRSKKM